MWDALAAVWKAACAESCGPRYCPGCHPCDRSMRWPNESVLRLHFVLFGSFPSLRLLECLVRGQHILRLSFSAKLRELEQVSKTCKNLLLWACETHRFYGRREKAAAAGRGLTTGGVDACYGFSLFFRPRFQNFAWGSCGAQAPGPPYLIVSIRSASRRNGPGPHAYSTGRVGPFPADIVLAFLGPDRALD